MNLFSEITKYLVNRQLKIKKNIDSNRSNEKKTIITILLLPFYEKIY